MWARPASAMPRMTVHHTHHPQTKQWPTSLPHQWRIRGLMGEAEEDGTIVEVEAILGEMEEIHTVEEAVEEEIHPVAVNVDLLPSLTVKLR